MTTTMQLIAKQTVGAGGAASVTFSNIPQTYTDLKVVCTMRTDRSATEDPVTITFNTGGTYSDRRLWANGSSVASYNATTLNAEYANSTSSTASTFSNFEMYIPNYTSTSNAKSISYDSVTENNATTGYNILDAALWTKSPQEAITSITLDPIYGNFVQYCTFYLYGISNSTTTQATTVPYASGGDVITTDGTYWYHAFKYSGTFTPLKELSADVLVVAGGGGGGYNTGGGGGAGGLRTFTAQTLTSATNFTCTIGAGGAAGYTGGASDYRGLNGGNSSFAGSGFTTITASGGGGGGTSASTPYSTYAVGRSGGSGGGASRGGIGSYSGATGNSGNYTPVEGYAGGDNGPSSPGGNSGGGGGAGGAGVNATAYNSGAGGVGFYNSLTDAMGAATATGVLSSAHYYYAGGGGGGSYTGSAGAGGLGGGGAGSPDNSAGSAGSANLGGGGGGGNNNNNPTNAANGYQGGSGIIIVRYAV